MPKIVDSDERRATLIDATSEAIARDGLANVTLRSIARSGGWTTGIVTHYFADKRALLTATFVGRADRARQQIITAVAGGTSLLEAAIATLPGDDESMLDWRVWVAYIGAAVGDDELAELHRARVDSFARTLAEGLVEEQHAGRLPAHLDPTHEADRLVALITGIAVQAVLRSDQYSAQHQRELVHDHLRALRASVPAERVARNP